MDQVKNSKFRTSNLLWVLGLIIMIIGGGWWFGLQNKSVVLSPEAPFLFIEKPLEKADTFLLYLLKISEQNPNIFSSFQQCLLLNVSSHYGQKGEPW